MTPPRNIAAFVVLIFWCPFRTDAALYVPPGLNPGDMYHLAFVTSGERDATSILIADYNGFVQAQAALNPTLTGTDIGISWRTIASTAAQDAQTNAPVLAPVYRLDGVKIADDFADLWDGQIDAPLSIDQFGAFKMTIVWTGSLGNGLQAPGAELGVGNVAYGNSSNSMSWVVSGLEDSNGELHSLYALSDKLTVPIPEPAMAITWLLLCGLATAVVIESFKSRVRVS